MYVSLLVKSKKVAENIPGIGYGNPGNVSIIPQIRELIAGSFVHIYKENRQRVTFL
jgi:hypothetical protein